MAQYRQGVQDRLQWILRGIDEASWDWDLVSGEDYYAPRWWQMLGYEVDELPSDADLWATICHPDDTEKFDEAFTQALSSGTEFFQLEYRLKHKQGQYISVLSRAYIERDASGKPISLSGANTDLTERKRVEAQLQESENRYRALMEWSPIGIAVYQRGLIVYANPAAMAILGAKGDAKLVGTPIINRVHPDYRQQVIEQIRLALTKHAKIPRHEEKLLRMDGTAIDVDIESAPIVHLGDPAVQVNFQDISEKKQAENKLKESQSQYQQLVEWSPVALAVHQDGLIVYVNPAAIRLWGAESADELVGTPIEARFHPQFHASALERIKTVLEKGLPVPLRQSKFLRLDGRAIDIETQSMPILYRGKRAIQINFQDYSSRRQIEQTLRESEERFRTLTRLSSDWYWEQDESFRFIMVSGNVLESTGLTSQAHAGKTHWELPALNLVEADWEGHRAIIQAHQEFRDFEIRRPDRDGHVHWVSVSGTPTFDTSGEFRGYRGIGRDISVHKQAVGQIHRLAFYDALTGLPNRRLLLEQLKKALQINTRRRQLGALLFIDLDNFKTLNDTLGHDVGDVLLQQVAQRLVANVREADTVARLGGDEFVVILDDLDKHQLKAASQADAVGQKILTALNVPYQLAGREHRSSPSIGITLFGAQGEGVDDLLKQADLAMYQAKAAGRNTLRFFDVGMQSEVDHRVALESDLRDGLQGGEELLLHFQPIVRVDGRVTGAEALVRWQQPQRGLVMPEDFIPLAESTGLILPLGRWVLNTACEQLAVWGTRAETAQLTIAVNVSARELREPDFVAQVKRTLGQTGANPNRLRLELTESVLAHKVEDIIVKMAELKALGICFSLDDFGTGYSSLSYLKQLPLDLLKIDRSFVHDVLTDPNDAAIARTIIALGQTLGLSVVAEGVETEDQRTFLMNSGCFAYQGYLFGEPMSIDQFDVFMRTFG